MYVSAALAFASTVGLTAARVHHSHSRSTISRRAVPAFPAGTSFDILLNKGSTNVKSVASSGDFSVIDIDLFDTDAATIADFKSAGKKVICYFSAGTREDWRSDKASFQSNDYGKAMEDWQGENWVNVKSDNVKSIMKKRIASAKEKGCDAVDPDNVDGFSGNQDGWGYKQADYAAYVKYLAQEAASANMAIGLKNALDLIPDVIDVVQFAVNEQCHEYNECGQYKTFTSANKAVFNIEYGGNKCDSPADVSLTILNKSSDQALNQLGGQCSVSGGAPAASQPAASVSKSASKTVTATAAVTATASKDASPSSVATTLATSVVVAPTATGAATKSSIAGQPSKSSVAGQPSKSSVAAKPSQTPSGGNDDDEDDEDKNEDEGDDEDEDEEEEEEEEDEDEDEEEEEEEEEDEDEDEGGRGHGKGHRGNRWRQA